MTEFFFASKAHYPFELRFAGVFIASVYTHRSLEQTFHSSVMLYVYRAAGSVSYRISVTSHYRDTIFKQGAYGSSVQRRCLSLDTYHTASATTWFVESPPVREVLKDKRGNWEKSWDTSEAIERRPRVLLSATLLSFQPMLRWKY